ncbi:MAG: deoxyguanosinetriphosphate triphosphohydrolase, partial [Tabrizicola sp.]
VREIGRRYPDLEPARYAPELIRRLITWMIDDVAAEATRRLNALAPSSADDIRNADRAVIGFSAPMAEAERSIKDFLFPRMYRHARVMRVMGEAEGVLRDLFRHFVSAPDDMPEEWRIGLAGAGEATRARRAGDFIAGMTDRFALQEHRRFFDSTPELR